MQKSKFLANIITFLHAFKFILPKGFNRCPCKFIFPQHKYCSIYSTLSQVRAQKLHQCLHCSVCTLMELTVGMFSEHKIKLTSQLLQLSYLGEKNVQILLNISSSKNTNYCPILLVPVGKHG